MVFLGRRSSCRRW